MVAVLICERMGWTYEEYLTSPTRFLIAITEMIKAEANERNKQNKK